jgi:hypothetical protein
MKLWILILSVLVAGCTVVRINVMTYCHTKDGYYLIDDPHCQEKKDD